MKLRCDGRFTVAVRKVIWYMERHVVSRFICIYIWESLARPSNEDSRRRILKEVLNERGGDALCALDFFFFFFFY